MSRSSNRKNNSNDEDYVSMETMRDMMEQQKSFYTEMLNRQEANFMSFTKMILESTTNRTDGVMKEIQEIKSSLQFSQTQIDDLRVMEKKIDSFELDLQSLSSQSLNCENKDITSKMDYLDNQSRRNNVIIDGLTQDKSYETWSDTDLEF